MFSVPQWLLVNVPPDAEPAAPVFRATADCPIPRGWIASALVVGLVLGYLWAKG